MDWISHPLFPNAPLNTVSANETRASARDAQQGAASFVEAQLVLGAVRKGAEAFSWGGGGEARWWKYERHPALNAAVRCGSRPPRRSIATSVKRRTSSGNPDRMDTAGEGWSKGSRCRLAVQEPGSRPAPGIAGRNRGAGRSPR